MNENMNEKYETPKVEFVEMENEDIMTASGGCPQYKYGDVLVDD